jgi:hypothetical protein
MQMIRPRLFSIVLALALAIVAVVGPSAGAEPSPIRQHIKDAKKALFAIEKEIGPLVHKAKAMEVRLDTIGSRIKASRQTVDRLSKRIKPHELALAALSPDLVGSLGVMRRAAALNSALKDLSTALLDKETLGPILPKVRDRLWELGSERTDRIDDLDLAIEQLEAVRGGDVPIKAGVGAGKLITYSADWVAVSMCESSGNWQINTGLFDGGLQFLPSTWWMFGGGEYARFAYQATKKQQIDIAERVLAVQGPKAWPNCFKPLPVDAEG